MNGEAYTWDANGNLLSDGEYNYSYNHANRLSSVSDGVNTTTYTYNGDRDRVSKSTNGTVTQYVLDLNHGLTQTLSNGTDTYLYGNGRISQTDADSMEYFLGDALGSVRQLVDAGGTVTLNRSYEPFGEALTSQGSGESDYAYTGEQYDSETGLVYLRARYYSPAVGRFVSKDTWTGVINQPVTYNLWAYANLNPIIFVDYSGYSSTCNSICDFISDHATGICNNKGEIDNSGWKALILTYFGISMSDDGHKDWDDMNLLLMFNTLNRIDFKMEGKLLTWVNGATLKLYNQDATEGQYKGSIHLDDRCIDIYTINNDALRQMNILHEFGHLLDNVDGSKDVFTNDVDDLDDPTWVDDDDMIEADALKVTRLTNDPNYDSVQARQTFSNYGPSEQWADAFANYIIDNIDNSEGNNPGVDMYNFVRDEIVDHIL